MRKNHHIATGRALRILAVVIIVAGCLWTLRFTLSTGDRPWFARILTIDGQSHINGVKSLIERDAVIDLKDVYHSPGYQIYLSVLRRVWGSDEGFFRFSKIVSWVMYVSIVLMVIWLGIVLAGLDVGLLAGVIVSWSAKYHVYVNLLQGEALQGFAFTGLAVIFLLFKQSKKTKWRLVSSLSASLVMASLVLSQVRFLPILVFLPLAAWAVERKSADRFKTISSLIAPALIILISWSAYQSNRLEKTVVVSEGSEFRLKVAYNPNSTGAAFPYPDVVEPSGLKFIGAEPAKTAALLLKRFAYLWDLKRDIWYLGNPFLVRLNNRISRSSWDLWIHGAALCLFVLGLALSVREIIRSKSFKKWGMPYAILAANFAGPMLVFGSSRFLIPAVPMIALFQAFAIARLFSFFEKRLK